MSADASTLTEEYRAPGSTRRRTRERRRPTPPAESPDLVTLLFQCVTALPVLLDDVADALRVGTHMLGAGARLVPETVELGYLTVEHAGRGALRVLSVSAKVERGADSR